MSVDYTIPKDIIRSGEPFEIDGIKYVMERTCRIEHVKSGTLYDVWRYTCCDYEHSESRTDAGASEIPQNYCPNCGAKVVH